MRYKSFNVGERVQVRETHGGKHLLGCPCSDEVYEAAVRAALGSGHALPDRSEGVRFQQGVETFLRHATRGMTPEGRRSRMRELIVRHLPKDYVLLLQPIKKARAP